MRKRTAGKKSKMWFSKTVWNKNQKGQSDFRSILIGLMEAKIIGKN